VKASDGSLNDFHDSFINFCFEFSEDDVDWPLMKDKFDFLVHISMNPNEYESLESILTYIGIRASKYVINGVVVRSDFSCYHHLTTLFPQVEVGVFENSSTNLPPSPPTPHTNNFTIGLDCEYDVCDDFLSPHPPSIDCFGPPYCEFFGSLVSNFYVDVHGSI